MRAKEKNHDYLPTAPNHVDLGGSKVDFLLDYLNIIKKIPLKDNPLGFNIIYV